MRRQGRAKIVLWILNSGLDWKLWEQMLIKKFFLINQNHSWVPLHFMKLNFRIQKLGFISFQKTRKILKTFLKNLLEINLNNLNQHIPGLKHFCSIIQNCLLRKVLTNPQNTKLTASAKLFLEALKFCQKHKFSWIHSIETNYGRLSKLLSSSTSQTHFWLLDLPQIYRAL